jgi:ankyrin repeat protein
MEVMINLTKELDSNQQRRDFDNGCMLLHNAAANGDKATILAILHQGADLMAEDSLHRLPMEVAISSKNSKCFLLKNLFLTPILILSFNGKHCL